MITNSSTKRKMNREILTISKYSSLMLAKHTLSILVICYIVAAMIFQYDSLPAFYILAANQLFPVILRYLIQNHAQATTAKQNKTKKEEAADYLLPLTVKRYRYSLLQYQCNSMTFLLDCLFLYLWQRRLQHAMATGWNLYVPTAILICILFLRTCGIAAFIAKIKYELRNPSA